jgi:hypothetical protein
LVDGDRRMRFVLVVIVFLVGAALSVVRAAEAPDAQAGPPIDRKWKLVFRDEFDGTAIDEATWKPSDYTTWDHPGFKTRLAKENCGLDGEGHLVVRLTQDEDGTIAFNGGLITRDFQKAFGYIETRVRFSTQPGWWGFVCTIRNNTLSNYGDDLFENPQEFDVFEDFFKPKAHPFWPEDRHHVISQAFHATVGLGFQDQGDGSGATDHDTRKKNMLAVTAPGRVLRHEYHRLQDYGGWHTVALRWGPLENIFFVDGKETYRTTYKDTPITNVPQKLVVGSVFKTPKPLKRDAEHDAKYPPFYGWLEDAKLPDQLVVDYIRWYDEDPGEQSAPAVTLALDGDRSGLVQGRPATFRVNVTDKDGSPISVQLFAKGYLRAEAALDATGAAQTFTITNLFPGANTLIATAVDDDGLVGLSAPLRVTVKSAAASPAASDDK